MAGLKGWILRLAGRDSEARGYGGWVRIDADNVVRGWVRDQTNPDRRPLVEVRVDGQVIGQARADRLDPKLLASGEGDGRHAFAVLVPARWRDGAPHSLEAEVVGDGYRLMSKSAAFAVPGGAREPSLEITRLEPSGATGVLCGGQYSPDVQLDLWNGGVRIEGLSTTWRQRGPQSEFRLSWPAKVLGELQRDATIAAPGMHEAGVGEAALFGKVRLQSRLTLEGKVETRLQGVLALDDIEDAAIELRQGRDGTAQASAPLSQAGATLNASLQNPGQLWAQLVLDGRAIPAIAAPVDTAVAGLLANTSFAEWDGERPRAWDIGGEVSETSRGFYAFPDGLTREHGLRGDLVRLQVATNGTLLRQALPAWPQTAAATGSIGAVCRASCACTLQVRVVGAAGEAPQVLQAPVTEPWAWAFAQAPAAFGAPAGVAVELVLTSSAEFPLTVEVAEIRVGGASFQSGTDQPPPGLPANLVENGDLLDWPRGLVLEASGGRMETAAGWFVQNRKGKGSVKVAAMAAGLDKGVGLAVAAAEVGDYCRIEARLHPEALSAAPRLRLTFEAAIPADAPAAYQGRSPFVVIERIFLLRRGRRRTDGGMTLATEVVTVIARRLILGREPQSFAFDVDLDPDKAGPDDIEDAELFVAFDFDRGFSAMFRNVGLAPAPARGGEAKALGLEDRAIAAQARTLAGLRGWVSPDLAEPGVRFSPFADEEPATAQRWAWSPTLQGSVEVVICVHDAADETLACLRSLVAGSGVLHTVRIIDDGSGQDTRERLLAFIADRPWMRLISNDGNLGYTASANLGVRGSHADWVILLNSDTVVAPSWIEGLLECAASDPQIAFVGPVSNAASFQSVPELKDRTGKWKVNALPPGWSPRRMAAFVTEASDKAFPRAPLLNGFCTLMRREAFVALGGFNEAAFPHGYGEENDLCVRATEAGYALAVADHVYVHHAKSASFGAGRRAELQKAAGKALAELHPDVDFTALGDRFREIPALSRLRARVRELYETAV